MIEEIIKVLETGLEKHWEIQLTNKYLLNILKMAQRNNENSESEADCYWVDMRWN